jgi:integrase
MREDAKYKSPDTYNRAIQCAKNLLPEIGNYPLSEITPSVLSAYRTKRLEENVTLSTVNKELQFVRRVFSLCKRDWQFVKQSPFEFFKMTSVNDQRVRFLEHGQWEQLLMSCPSWLKPIVTLARYTGMRRGNIIRLTWRQVDLQNKLINLDKTKNGQMLTIPLTGTAYNLLENLKKAKVIHLNCPYVFHSNGTPHKPHKVSMAFKRACNRAGIDDFRFHDLRHDFASNLVQNGNDLYLVQHLLGHKDGRMTQRYAHLKVEQLRQAVETLDKMDSKVHKKGHSENAKGATVAVTP